MTQLPQKDRQESQQSKSHKPPNPCCKERRQRNTDAKRHRFLIKKQGNEIKKSGANQKRKSKSQSHTPKAAYPLSLSLSLSLSRGDAFHPCCHRFFLFSFYGQVLTPVQFLVRSAKPKQSPPPTPSRPLLAPGPELHHCRRCQRGFLVQGQHGLRKPNVYGLSTEFTKLKKAVGKHAYSELKTSCCCMAGEYEALEA